MSHPITRARAAAANCLPTAECATANCQHLVQPGFLMCLPHWRQVPRVMQRDVWTWYRQIGRRSDAARSYQAAVAAAVEAVYQKQLAAEASRSKRNATLF
ncbi:hypothetical protein [Paucibacter sp. Y2R2-4]|uniref:hypothetical protein n=1 Tax=Paucibacter sp. Y2R2-4 TaxID=2893553 RepID=UPI0021E496E5|nr:hypothetical protein [Paucibacter sp. Y2R2-4]MCV2349318.1 hypothetical protein [Paucibacter sp. Y2R2-4]